MTTHFNPIGLQNSKLKRTVQMSTGLSSALCWFDCWQKKERYGQFTILNTNYRNRKNDLCSFLPFFFFIQSRSRSGNYRPLILNAIGWEKSTYKWAQDFIKARVIYNVKSCNEDTYSTQSYAHLWTQKYDVLGRYLHTG